MSKSLRALIIEDNYPDFVLFRELLDMTKFTVSHLDHATSMSGAKKLLGENSYDIIFADLHLTDTSGIETVHELVTVFPVTPVIIFSGLSDENLALEAIARGAQDYLNKGSFDPNLLQKSIQYALERHKTQREINIANERFNFAMKATADVIWDWNIPEEVITRSKNNLGLSYQHTEFQNMETMNFFSDCKGIYEGENIQEDIQAALKNKTITYWEKRYKKPKKGNSWTYIHDKAYIMRNEEGNPLRVIGAMRDITALVQSEHELLESEKRLQSIIDSSNECFILLDKNFTVLLFNFCAEETLRLVTGRLLTAGSFFRDIVPKEVGEFVTEGRAKILSGTMIEEVFTVMVQGAEMHMHVKCFPVLDIDNTINGILFNVINITQRVELEKQLTEVKIQEQKKILRQTLEVQEKERTYLGSELHDNINQLLAAASIQLDAGYKSDDNELLRELTARALNILNKTIQEIRTLSHAMVDTASRDGLVGSINESINMARTNENISFEFDHSEFDENKISPQQKLHIYRIFQELLMNVMKYSKATRVRLNLTSDKTYFYLSVSDNGVGFDVKKVKSGIGLFNIRNRVNAFNGTFEIESGKGTGTTSRVVIPLHIKEQPAIQAG